MALWSERKFEIIISPELFAELVEVLNRHNISPHVDGQRKLALFRRLRFDAIWTAGTVIASGELPDPGDDFLLTAALEAEAEFIVTWDARLLEHGGSRGVQIISPDQFISLIVRMK
ncbi:MAG: hypothetical protein A2Z45_00590 [Chloroflexi bacterium RBG_19FT_COMBO_55_16]|nr:MAG: hypothetical protein A2Z45_00590 [Chloroflexi bacterium RBG_19FT_COMBO_55_16]